MPRGRVVAGGSRADHRHDQSQRRVVQLDGCRVRRVHQRSGLHRPLQRHDEQFPSNLGDYFASSTLGSAQGSNIYSYFFSLGANGRLAQFGSPMQTFVAGLPAFTGSATGNYSFLNFQPGGFVGNVEVVNNFGDPTGVIIGEYRIIPAPGAAALLGLGSLAVLRRRR